MELHASIGETHSSNKDHNICYERDGQGFVTEKSLIGIMESGQLMHQG